MAANPPKVVAAPSLFHDYTVPRAGSPIVLPGQPYSPPVPIVNGPWTSEVGALSGRPTGPDAGAAPESYPLYSGNSSIVLSKAQENQIVSTDPVAAALIEPGRPYQGTTLISNPRERPPAPSRILRSPDTYRFMRPFDVSSAKHLNGSHSSGADSPRYQAGISVPSKGLQVFPTHRNTYRVTPPPRDVMIMDAPPDMQVPSAIYSNPAPNLYPGSSSRGTYRLG